MNSKVSIILKWDEFSLLVRKKSEKIYDVLWIETSKLDDIFSSRIEEVGGMCKKQCPDALDVINTWPAHVKEIAMVCWILVLSLISKNNADNNVKKVVKNNANRGATLAGQNNPEFCDIHIMNRNISICRSKISQGNGDKDGG